MLIYRFQLYHYWETVLNYLRSSIALSQIFPRIYDCILDSRFNQWYNPNREQAGFRKGQGCLLQIFAIVLLIHNSKEINHNLIVGFLDYEKAFDFTNRAKIISKLMQKGCGKRFTTAITNMYDSSTYIPIVNGKLCQDIKTSYGVTRHSSADLYSFYVLDLSKCTEK